MFRWRLSCSSSCWYPLVVTTGCGHLDASTVAIVSVFACRHINFATTLACRDDHTCSDHCLANDWEMSRMDDEGRDTVRNDVKVSSQVYEGERAARTSSRMGLSTALHQMDGPQRERVAEKRFPFTAVQPKLRGYL